MEHHINIRNKKASFEFELSDKYIAGIKLTGTEIKAIREGKVSFIDAFCVFVLKELWVRGLHISEYSYGTYNNHVPKRERKLLLNRAELNKIERKIREKGLTLVPTRLFINDRGFAKMEIAIAKGKKTHDKREDIKKKDSKLEMDRSMKK